MSFLPEDYKRPTGGSMNTLKEKENYFRILSSAVVGFEYWTTDKKPVRLKEKPKQTPEDIKRDDKGVAEDIKHFWAFAIWNYNTEEVEIMKITQATVQGAIEEYVKNEKWSDPKNYDITVAKTGEGFGTKYSVMPSPKDELCEEATKALASKTIDLEGIFKGTDMIMDHDTPITEANELSPSDIIDSVE